jgi:hypothetical protein
LYVTRSKRNSKKGRRKNRDLIEPAHLVESELSGDLIGRKLKMVANGSDRMGTVQDLQTVDHWNSLGIEFVTKPDQNRSEATDWP